ncbi:hypothetical protein [Klebsiella variicola]|uniref:hypothetical protein n=1 Tax=Klebsiella variicola TaxID=244366 RepID=UPI0023614C27|nr:hypothetical protein [Klebsiella variicola]
MVDYCSMKLFTCVLLILASPQISGSEIFESIAGDLKVTDLVFCYAGFEKYGVTATSAMVNAMRTNTSKETKEVLQTDLIKDFLEQENIKAYSYGVSLKKQGNRAYDCLQYSENRVNMWAISTCHD